MTLIWRKNEIAPGLQLVSVQKKPFLRLNWLFENIVQQAVEL